jgi:hypothetical protein
MLVCLFSLGLFRLLAIRCLSFFLCHRSHGAMAVMLVFDRVGIGQLSLGSSLALKFSLSKVVFKYGAPAILNTRLD